MTTRNRHSDVGTGAFFFDDEFFDDGIPRRGWLDTDRAHGSRPAQ